MRSGKLPFYSCWEGTIRTIAAGLGDSFDLASCASIKSISQQSPCQMLQSENLFALCGTPSDLCLETCLDSSDGALRVAVVAFQEVQAVFTSRKPSVGRSADFACDVFACNRRSESRNRPAKLGICTYQCTASERFRYPFAGNGL